MADNIFRKTPLDLVLESQSTVSPPPTAQPVEQGPRIKSIAGEKSRAAREQQLMPAFTAAAQKYQVPLNIVMALAEQESGYNPKAVGIPTKWGTAKGVMQYLDSTAQGLGIDSGDPIQSIDAAARQIRERLDNGYSMEDAVKEHFAGPDRAQWGPKTEQYGKDVMERAMNIANRLGAVPPALDLTNQAPSPLKPEVQNAWAEERGIEPPFKLTENKPQQEPQQLPITKEVQLTNADGTPMTPGGDGFVSATGKALGNIPERFQLSVAGLLQKVGEGMDDTSLYAEASKAGILKALQDSGEIVMKDGGGLAGTKLPYFKDGTFAGVSEVAEYLRKNPEKVAGLAGLEPNAITQAGREMGEQARKDMTPINPDGAAAKYGSMIIQSSAEMLPAILGSIVTKNPATGMAMIGGQVYGQSYDTARNPDQGKQKLNPSEASDYAMFQSLAEAIPESLPISVIIKPSANFFKGILKAGAAEAAQEGVTGALQAGIDKGTIDPNMTWGEARQQIVDSMIVGAGAGGTLKAGVDGARMAQEAMRSPEEKLGRAMNEQVESGGGFAPAELEAANLFNPSNAQEQMAQPAAPTGPLGRALANAPGMTIPPAAVPAAPVAAPQEQMAAPEQAQPAEPASQQTPFDDLLFENIAVDVGGDQMTGQVTDVTPDYFILKGEDGNAYQIPLADVQQGVATIIPNAQQQTQPETAQAPEVTTPAQVEAQQPERAPAIEDMSPAQLHQRMDFLQRQAKQGGWDKRLLAERDRVNSALADLREREMMQRDEEQDTEIDQPVSQPQSLAAREFAQPEVNADETNQASQEPSPQREPVAKGVPATEVVPEARDAGQRGVSDGAGVVERNDGEAVPAGQPTSEQPAPLNKPIPEVLGADGKPKWFGSKPKAIEFIDKKGLADTHEVKKVGAKWEIHPIEQVQQTEIAVRPAESVSGETVKAPVQAEASSQSQTFMDEIEREDNQDAYSDIQRAVMDGVLTVEQANAVVIRAAEVAKAGRDRGLASDYIEEYITRARGKPFNYASTISDAELGRLVVRGDDFPEFNKSLAVSRVGSPVLLTQTVKAPVQAEASPSEQAESDDNTPPAIRKRIDSHIEEIKKSPQYDDAFSMRLQDALSSSGDAWAQSVASDPNYGSIKDIIKEETGRGAMKWYIDNGREAEGLKLIESHMKILNEAIKKAEGKSDFAGSGYTAERSTPEPVDMAPASDNYILDMNLAKNRLHMVYPDGPGGLTFGMGMDDEVHAYNMAAGIYSNLPDSATAQDLDKAIDSYAAPKSAKETLRLLIEDGVKRMSERVAERNGEKTQTKSAATNNVVAFTGNRKEDVPAQPVAQTQTQVAEAKQAGLSEEELKDRNLLKEHAGRWKYRSSVGSGWFTANTKESAVERAQDAYRKAVSKGEQVPTRDERFAQANEELFSEMDRRYGKMSTQELEAEYQRLGGEVGDLQSAGAGEFTGNGGRRTSAAVSNEGARQVGDERLRLGVYMKMRQERHGEQTNQAPVEPASNKGSKVTKESLDAYIEQEKASAEQARKEAADAVGTKHDELNQVAAAFSGEQAPSRNVRNSTLPAQKKIYETIKAVRGLDDAYRFDKLIDSNWQNDRQEAIKLAMDVYAEQDAKAGESATKASANEISVMYGGSKSTLKLSKPVYEYTKDEFSNKLDEEGHQEIRVKGKRVPSSRDLFIKERETEVIDAIKQGKNVPVDVLAEYPSAIRPGLTPDQLDQMADDLRNLRGAELVNAVRSWGKEATKPSANTIFTEDAAEKARALLRSKLGQLNSGVDPEILQAGITLAGYHIEAGARTFAAYTKAMISDLGDMVRPYLKSWYMGVKYDPRAASFDGMSSAAEVEAFNVDEDIKSEDRIDGDIRGKAWAIVKDGNVIASGSEPSLAAPGPMNNISYHIELAKKAGGDLYVGDNTSSFKEGSDGLIFGMTWDELSAKQQGRTIPKSVSGKIPKNATLVFSSNEGEKNEPDTIGNVERNGTIPENAVGEEAGAISGSRSLRDAERAADAAVAEGRTRPADSSGVPATGPLDVGASGDQRVPDSGEQSRAAPGVAGASDARGNRRGGGAGVQSEREADTRLRAKAQKRSAELTGRAKKQAEADKVAVKVNDEQNIADTLPLLSEPQQRDVLKVERRLYHDGGKGIMLTNGTGTGKTYVGLGGAKRVVRRGGSVLVVCPAGVIPAWEAGAKDLGMEPRRLKNKQDAGSDGLNVTSYQNFRDNPELMRRNFDLVIYDESHHLMANMGGDSTSANVAHKAMTGHPDSEMVRGQLVLAKEFAEYRDDAQKEIDKLVKQGVNAAEANRQVFESDRFQKRYAALVKRADNISKDLAAEQKQKNTKVLFLSASPFSGHKSVFYGDGYLFDSKVGAKDSQAYNTGSPEAQYLVSNFGYRMRYNKVTQPGAEVDVGLLERDWADRMFQTGAMSGRKIDLDHDYSREFVSVAAGIGEQIDRAFQTINWKEYPQLASQLINWRKGGSDRQLTEALRARASLDRIEKHLKMGRKVVVFHERQQLNITNPFAFNADTEQAKAEIAQLKQQHPWIFQIDLKGLATVPAAIGARFGDRVAYFSGLNKNTRDKELAEFNKDGGTKDILVIQKDAGKEGLSAHDITGKHPRALMILNTPVSPADAIQMEGRTYRHGLRSDAIIEYPTIQTSFEKTAYRETVSTRTSTAENLAMGSEARNLREAFREGYLDPSVSDPSDKQGVGGKKADSASDGMTMFDRAKTYYFRRQKKTSRNKAAEGEDYFATPEPLGFKMVEWAKLNPGDKALEPSGGHGAISRWLPESTTNLAIEPSPELVGELGIVTNGEVRQMRFEELNTVNKFHAVVMNPPFGKGGAAAIEHIGKAVDHLKDGGRVVAIYPKGPAADAKFDKWFEDKKGVYLVASIDLPTVTFNRAGTGVATRIVVLDKDTRGNNVYKGQIQRDLTAVTDINELFKRIEDMDLPGRPNVAVSGRDVNLAEENIKEGEQASYRATMTEFTRTGPAAVLGLREVKKIAEKFGGEVSTGGRVWKETHFDFATEQERERFFAGVLDAYEAQRGAGKYSIGAARGTAADLTRDPIVKALVDSGKVVIHKDTSTLPSERKDGVAGLTTRDGVIHVVEGKNARSVLLHEAFHAGSKSLLGMKNWRNLMNQLERMYHASKNSQGFWKNAYLRSRLNGLPDGSRLAIEEFGAYAIENFDRAPAGVRKWVESLIGAIKSWLRLRFDYQAGNITGGQLRYMARAALRSMYQPQETAQLGELYSGGSTSTAVNRTAVGRGLTDVMPALLGAAPLDRMIQELGKATPSLKSYLKEKMAMDAYRNKLHQKHDAMAQEWLTFNMKNRKAGKDLSRLMHDSTIAQIDPSKDLQGQIDLMLSEDYTGWDQDDKPSKETIIKQATKSYAELKEAYDALPEKARHLYQKVRNAYQAQVKELDKILMENLEKAMDLKASRAERAYDAEIERINADGLTGTAKDEAIAKAEKRLKAAKTKHGYNKAARMTLLRQQFERNRLAGPYFPLSRFGNFFVTAKDGSGKVVEFSRHENEGQQLRAANELRDQGFNVETGFLYNEKQLRNGVDPAFAADIEEILQDSGASDAVKDQVWQRYLETMPEVSMRKRFIHRKGRAGFNEDALRAFASHMFHSAHQMARMKFGGTMKENIEQAKVEARKAPDTTRAAMVVDAVDKKNDFVMNPTGSSFAQALTSLGFAYHLGVSPASAIVNASQTVMLGVPILGSKFGRMGMTRASYELGRAMVDFTVGKGDIAKAKLTADEKDAIKQAYELGVVDKSQAHDLAGVGDTGSEYSPLRSRVMAAIGWAFHRVEVFNREVTFVAAYRLARKAGEAHEKAIETASELTWKTHFNYDNSNRPRVLQSDTAKVLLLFRNYNINMLFRLFRDSYQAINATNKQERREALHQLGGVTGMMMMSAGLRGTWLYGIAMMIASLIFGDDAEDQMKAGMIDMLGKDTAGMLLNGVPGHLTGIDLSSRIGMPDLWFRTSDKELEGDDQYHYWLEQLAGPLGGIAKNMMVGYSMATDGEPARGLETASPTAIKNLIRAGRYANEGARTMKGDTLVDDVSWADVFKQAIGFTPAKIAEQYRTNSVMKNKESAIRQDRQQVLNAWGDAYRKDDKALWDKAQADLDAYNEANPDYPIRADDVRASIRQSLRNSERNEGGITLNRRLNDRIRSTTAPSIYQDGE